MRVTFEDVLNRTYTTLITDYHLDNLIKMDEQAFYTFLSGFLINSIDKFDGCLTNLGYHEEEVIYNEGTDEEYTKIEYVFDEDLTSKEVYILCLGIAITWYKKAMDDVTQFKLHLSSKDFKNFSEAQNLQRRIERLCVMEEEFDREIASYQLSNLSKLPFFGGV